MEHATFTPLVIGTNGGMGDECEKFLKNLAELLCRGSIIMGIPLWQPSVFGGRSDSGCHIG